MTRRTRTRRPEAVLAFVGSLVSHDCRDCRFAVWDVDDKGRVKMTGRCKEPVIDIARAAVAASTALL